MDVRKLPDKLYTVEKYIKLVENSLEKLEYHDGMIVEMAGASSAHNRIAKGLSASHLVF